MRRRYDKGDVSWYISGRKRPIAYSTVAASELIVALSQDGATVKEVHDRITYDAEARSILEVYIKRGYGNAVARELFK